MQIPTNILNRHYKKYSKDYNKKIKAILNNGYYINGPEVEKFEKEFADYCGAKYAVGLASGLDALSLTFKILNIGKGDEVIVQSNTYIATVMGITINSATPIFVEPNKYFNMDPNRIEERITPQTKAILVTHLYGQPSDMGKIMQIATKHNLLVVEDCAQAHGAKYDNKVVGTFGIVGCYSFYPSKNLGAYGDAGGIITNNKDLADMFRIYRNYGSEKRYYNKYIGANSRLDELQAGLLRIKLTHLNDINNQRKKIAKYYLSNIHNPLIELPKVQEKADSVWHQFVIKTELRDDLKKYLEKHGIPAIIHYPIPPHLAEAYQYLGYKKGDFKIAEKYSDKVLSLPINEELTTEEQKYIVETVSNYRQQKDDK